MVSDTPPGELADRYEALYPGAVTDVLDNWGIHDQTLVASIGPITVDMTTAGVAYPVVGRPNRSVDPDENIRNILQMLGDVPEHSVVMYDANDDHSAHIGELSVTSLQSRGCRGAVVDGGARDVSYILERDFPLFTRFETPADAVPRWEILDWGVTTVVGGVEVSPGDIVVADVDGVVVVPEGVAEEVLLEAEDLKETENQIREAVLDGALPLEAYEEYGKF
jgi:regulator of RNase E activity RraA